MSTIVKVSLGLVSVLVVAASSTAAYFVNATQSDSEDIPGNPISIPRKVRSGKPLANGMSGKFGNKFKNFLVDTENTENDEGWNKKYESLKSQGFGSEAFKEVNDASKLKETCKKAYEQNGDRSNNDLSSISSSFKVPEILHYCSGGTKAPKKLEQDKYPQNSVAKRTDLFSYLMSVEDGENEEFGSIRDDEFYGRNGLSISGSTVSASLFKNNVGHDFFDKGKSAQKYIKDLCKEAYSFPSTYTTHSGGGTIYSDRGGLLKNTMLYCSLEYADS